MAATVGMHCLLDLYDCPSELLNDRLFIEQAMRDAAQQGLASLVKEVSHQFKPHGVTSIGLLAESHLSIHTWPEHCYAAVDVFTCGDTADPKQACLFLAQRLQAKNYSLQKVERGAETQALCPTASIAASQ